MDLQASFRSHSLRQGPADGPSSKFSAPFFTPRSSRWTFRQVFQPILCAKVQPMDLQASFSANSLRQGPADGPSSNFFSQFFAPRSNRWTFRQVFQPNLCVKVQAMDLQASFRPHSLRQGPADGPSGKFFSQFFAPRSKRWTFRQVFGPIPCAKVQPMDLPASFRPHFLRQGPTDGPSGKFFSQFFAPRSGRWTFKQVFRPFKQDPGAN